MAEGEFTISPTQWGEVVTLLRNYYPDCVLGPADREVLNKSVRLHFLRLRQASLYQISPHAARARFARLCADLSRASDTYFGHDTEQSNHRELMLLDEELPAAVRALDDQFAFGAALIELLKAVKAAESKLPPARGRPPEHASKEAFALLIFSLRWWGTERGCFRGPVVGRRVVRGDPHLRPMVDFLWLVQGWLPPEHQRHRHSKAGVAKAVQRALPVVMDYFIRQYAHLEPGT